MIMARGVRKSPKEKLQEKLLEVDAAITQYQQCLETLKAEKKTIEADLENLEIAELSTILKERNLTVDQLKQIVEQTECLQGAV